MLPVLGGQRSERQEGFSILEQLLAGLGVLGPVAFDQTLKDCLGLFASLCNPDRLQVRLGFALQRLGQRRECLLPIL